MSASGGRKVGSVGTVGFEAYQNLFAPAAPAIVGAAPDTRPPVTSVTMPGTVVAPTAPAPAADPVQRKAAKASSLRLDVKQTRVPTTLGPRNPAKRSLDSGVTRLQGEASPNRGGAARRGAKPPKSALTDAKRRSETKSATSPGTLHQQSDSDTRDREHCVAKDRPVDNEPKGGGGSGKSWVPWKEAGYCG